MSINPPTDAYCTIADVQALLPNRKYDATSRPTLDQAESIIKDVAKEINGVLRGLGYETPLTGTTDIEDLKTINKYGAAPIIEGSTLIGVQGQSALMDSLQKKYDAMFLKLVNGQWKFSDAGAPDSATPDANEDDETSGDRADPIFSISADARKTQF